MPLPMPGIPLESMCHDERWEYDDDNQSNGFHSMSMIPDPIPTITVPRRNIFLSYLLKLILINMVFIGAFYSLQQSIIIYRLFEITSFLWYVPLMFIPATIIFYLMSWIVWVLLSVLLYRLLCTVLDSKLIPVSEFHLNTFYFEIGLILFVMIAAPGIGIPLGSGTSKTMYYLIETVFPSISKLEYEIFSPGFVWIHILFVGGFVGYTILNLYNVAKMITLLVCKVQGHSLSFSLIGKRIKQFLIALIVLIGLPALGSLMTAIYKVYILGE
jgi:hypothetical protein